MSCERRVKLYAYQVDMLHVRYKWQKHMYHIAYQSNSLEYTVFAKTSRLEAAESGMLRPVSDHVRPGSYCSTSGWISQNG